MIPPIASGPVQAFFPLSSAIPNKLGALWETFVSQLSLYFQPLKAFSHRFSLFNWRSAALLSIAISIALLIENKRHAERSQQLDNELNKEKAGSKEKEAELNRQLKEAKGETSLWYNLYSSTTKISDIQKKDFKQAIQETTQAVSGLMSAISPQSTQPQLRILRSVLNQSPEEDYDLLELSTNLSESFTAIDSADAIPQEIKDAIQRAQAALKKLQQLQGKGK